MRQRPTWDPLRKAYSSGRSIADVYDTLHRGINYSTDRSAHGRGAEEIVEGFPSLLDVGAGRTSWAREMAPTVGVTDIAKSAISWLRETAQFENVYRMDMTEEWRFRDSSWHVITCFDVMEHIPPECIQHVLREMFRVASDLVVMSIAHFEHNAGPSREPLHLTVEDSGWWLREIEQIAGNRWEIPREGKGKWDPFWVARAT